MKEQNEKQAIEEMRELIHAEIKKAVDSGLITWTEFAQHLTERLTEQGYRKQEWISVEERLPELLQDVLCYRGNFKGNLMNTYTYLGQEMWKDDYGINYSTEEDGITHWIPLPEPPKMKGGAG